MIGDAKSVETDEAAVEATDGLSTVALEFLKEMLIGDAKIGAINELSGKSGVTRQLFHDEFTLARCQRITFHQCIGIFTKCKLLDFLEQRLQRLAGFEFVVIPRRRRISRKEHNERQIIANVKLNR